ncbi:MAG TPA: lysis system i-spanin subunit Rz [Candidatus Sulfotelmatobacter sp.]|jgi:hypothetical protein|nr:lysis system i-spanin subunit Rz [Candidatus Sulfotelmatobacter sp.]
MPPLTLISVIKDLPWKAIGIALAAVMLFGAGWTVNGWRYQRDIADMKTATADANTAFTEKVRMREIEWTNRYAAIDKAFTDQMRSDHEEIARLRAAVDDGSVRLRIAAKCPASDLRQTGDAAGLDHGAGAELDSNARSDYFALREGLIRQHRKLSACQQLLDEVTAIGGQP